MDCLSPVTVVAHEDPASRYWQTMKTKRAGMRSASQIWRRREHGQVLLEVMTLEVVTPPLSTYQEEVRFFLATALDRFSERWADPAGLGPDVNGGDDRQRGGSGGIIPARCAEQG